jgi:hypothetical protein
LYKWIHPEIINVGNCIQCGNITVLNDIFSGFRSYCSRKCSNNSTNVKQKKEASCLKTYGVKNPSISPLIKEKKKETCLKHYGEDCNLKLDKCKQQIKETNRKKYGTDYPIQSKEIRSNILQENYERFFTDVRYKNVTPLFSKEEYLGVELTYKFECKLCKSLFHNHLQDGHIPRCPICFPNYISKCQKDIIDYIKTTLNVIDIKENDRTILSGKEIDIYIPSHKLGIEFDGLYYHSELTGGISKKYHLDKTLQCQTKGIRLIHIFEDEWRFKEQIVKSRLQSILKTSPVKIYARKCETKIVPGVDSNLFLNENHLQVSDASLIKLGLYYKNELISVMTFGKLRKSLGSVPVNNHWEMYRFCSKINRSVIGGFGKLLNYFIKNYSPEKIISYSDRRWGTGEIYSKMGFSKILETNPNYFYTKDHSKRYHRYGFKKNSLSNRLPNFNPALSEWENMKNNGWDRIWDCGCTKYQLNFHPT